MKLPIPEGEEPPTPQPRKSSNEDFMQIRDHEIVEQITKRIKEIRHELDHTNPDYKRSIALQEALQEMVNLIGFAHYEEIMVGEKK